MALLDLETQVKPYLGITSNTYDTQLNIFIGSATAAVEGYLDRTLEQQEYTEILENQSSKFDLSTTEGVHVGRVPATIDYELRNYPVAPSTLVLESNGDVISSDSYDLKLENGGLRIYSRLFDTDWSLTATYTAGYTSGDLPAPLQGVILEGIRYMLKEWGGAVKVDGTTGDISSKRLGDFAVSYDNNTGSNSNSFTTKSWLSANEYILKRYQRISF